MPFRKKPAAPLAAVLAGLLLTSCGNSAAVQIKAAAYEPPEVMPSVSEEFTSGVQNFTVSTAAHILPDTDPQNGSVYSPASLYLALAMTAGLTAGQTQSEMLTVLGVDSAETLLSDSAIWYASLLHEGDQGTLSLPNSVWMRADFPFHQEAVDLLSQKYNASVYQADFLDASLPKAIAEWIREATGGLLGKDAGDFEPDPDTVMLLYSTLYYKGAWSKEFNTGQTVSDTFTLSDGSTVNAMYMNQTLTASYWEGEGFTAVSIPLRDGARMRLILPDEGISAQSFASDPENLRAAFFPENTETAQVELHLPKFDLSDQSDDLPGLLSELGMPTAFTNAADFSPLSDESLFLSNIRQQATLSIDEKGCVGAAFTEVSVDTSAAMIDKEVEMDFNRPFLYLLEYAGTPLFTGIVANPAN